MRNVRKAACAALGICVLFGCSTFRDQSKAMVGGGAVAGQDYINGLMPSAKARAYFAENSSDEMTKSVTISRTGDDTNDTGVRFVANGGVVIPPGVSITFENQGYCCDPHLPAPMAGDEYQFVKTSQLIPDELQPIYRKLMTKASNGDEVTLRNMQKLVWALRTAGTEAGYANNLTEQERRILNSCSEYEGEFESYCAEKLSENRLWKFLWAKLDSVATINIGGVTYQASDLLDENVGEKKIKEHLGQLITLGESMPVEHNGFNYGEISDGIYTDIKGTGALRFKATVANSTSREFTFYPMDYVAQVGSGVSDESASVVYYATASSTQKQRVTMVAQNYIEVVENRYIQNPNLKVCSNVLVKRVGESFTLSYPRQSIALPNGGVFNFSGGDVNVDIDSATSFWGRFSNGFKPIASNAGAFSTPDEFGFLSNNIYVLPDSSDEEVEHEGIHILTRKHPDLVKYKGTKNEEYLAYMISGKGLRSPQEIVNHLNSDEVYKSKAWIPW